jgi:hypothetical protein
MSSKQQVSYPSNMLSEEGFLKAKALTLMTKEARETLARKYFAGFIDSDRVLPLPIPQNSGLDLERCGYCCRGTVRYIEQWSVHWDTLVGRLDLAFND